MVSDWYVVKIGSEGNSAVDFSLDFHDACRKVDHLNQVYPADRYQVVHESRLTEYFDISDAPRDRDSSVEELED